MKERLTKNAWIPFDVPFRSAVLAEQDAEEFRRAGKPCRIRCYVRERTEAPLKWTPAVEVYRKQLMDKFASRCSMEQIASAAHILGGSVEKGKEGRR